MISFKIEYYSLVQLFHCCYTKRIHISREQTDQRSFDARRGVRRPEEPMEVNAIKSDKIDILTNAVLEMGQRLESVMAIGQHPPRSSFKKEGKRPKFEWTTDGKPVCFYCKKIGHKQTECRKKQSDLKKKAGQSPQPN